MKQQHLSYPITHLVYINQPLLLPVSIRQLNYTLSNQDKKFASIRTNKDCKSVRSSEFMRTCHNMNIIFQTTGVYEYSINGEIDKFLANITRSLLLNSSHNK